MKTKKEIAAETPSSITTMDNPIFVANKDLEVLSENLATPENGDFVIQDIPKNTKLRLLACKLSESGVSPFRWGEYGTVWIANNGVDHVSGSIGERVVETVI